MADAGIGEAMLISAAVGGAGGAAGSALGGGNLQDSLSAGLKGALLGGATGGIGAGIGSAMGAGTAATSAGLGEGLASGAGATGAGVEGAGSGIVNGGFGSLGGTTGATGAYPSALAGTDLAGASQGANYLNAGANAGAGTSGGISSLGSSTAGVSPNVFGYGPQSNLALGALGGTTALTSAMEAERKKYAPPGATPYTGILSKYDPYSAKGVSYPTHMAQGGITRLAIGGQPNQVYPMSFQNTPQFSNKVNMPGSMGMHSNTFEAPVDTMTGEPTQHMATGGIAHYDLGGSISPLMNQLAEKDPRISQYLAQNQNPSSFATGGITSLGHYSDGGQLLKGPGDGMSDDIPAKIGQHQPARLADGEFVIPADVVSHLGNGSTDAGAKHLYSMMNKVRKARTGNPKQGKQINPNKYLTS